MKGSRNIVIKNRNTQFQFTVNRNITIVCGDSGTGKTTLYNMVADYTALGADSGVQISSDCPCVALTQDANIWQYQLSTFHESLVFIDEGAKYITSHDFAAAIRETDNYYIIFTREILHELPYSVEEIYEIKTSRKYHTFHKRYLSREGHIYGSGDFGRHAAATDTVLTEDSRSGFEFFDHYFEGTSIRCRSSGSNSNIYSDLQAHHNDHIFVIADGAAFGAQMDRIMLLQKQFPENITVCLPESFEWLILSSGILPIDGIDSVINDPSAFIDSGTYFSWERFFTYYLIEHSAGTHFEYNKNHLHTFYLNRANMERIVSEIAALLPKKT